MLLGKSHAINCILVIMRKSCSGHSTCQSSASEENCSVCLFVSLHSLPVNCGDQPRAWYMGAGELWHLVKKGEEWKGAMWEPTQMSWWASPVLAAYNRESPASRGVSRDGGWKAAKMCQNETTTAVASSGRGMTRCLRHAPRWGHWHLYLSKSRAVQQRGRPLVLESQNLF